MQILAELRSSPASLAVGGGRWEVRAGHGGLGAGRSSGPEVLC